MADPSAIVSSLGTYRPDLERLLGDQAGPFFSQVEQLYGQVLAGSTDQATQDRIGDELLGLVRQQPDAAAFLGNVDPATFAQPETPPRTVADPPPDQVSHDAASPVVLQSAAPPAPDDSGTIITPVAAPPADPPGAAATPDPVAPPVTSTATAALPVGGDGASSASVPPPYIPPVPGIIPPAAPPAAAPAPAAADAGAPDRAVNAAPLTAGGVLFNKFLELLSGGITGLVKEVVAALIGLLLIFGTVVIAFFAALAAITNRVADFQAAKDVLLVMTGLTGVVLGYYFGRIPADARADQAQQTANLAQQQATNAQDAARDISAQADKVAGQASQVALTMQMQTRASSTRSLGAAPDPAQQRQIEQQLQELQRAVQDLRDKARRVR